MRGTAALTGATGFIGNTVARRLLADGWQVRALVRPASTSTRLIGPSVEWVEGELDEPSSLNSLVRNADVVVHCAGIVRGRIQADFARVNVDAVTRLARAAATQNPAPRFVLISSLAAREPELSAYATSKWQGELALSKAADGMAWVALRPPAVYGPGDKELLPLFRWMMRGLGPVLSHPGARFSLLYVDDLAEAVVKWVDSASQDRRAFELDDGRPDGYTWSDVVEVAERLRGKRIRCLPVPWLVLHVLAKTNELAAPVLGYAPMLTSGKVRELRHPNWVCDNTRFNRATSWVPQVSLEEGLRRTLSAEVLSGGSPHLTH